LIFGWIWIRFGHWNGVKIQEPIAGGLAAILAVAFLAVDNGLVFEHGQGAVSGAAAKASHPAHGGDAGEASSVST
jgi:hypothetical protein